MATASEIKLLLAIFTSGTVSSIDWEPVAIQLGCNKKAAAERWRAFKTKLPLPPGQNATDAQAKLLLALVSTVQVSGIGWEAVGNGLGCNKKAAAERWRAFKAKREKMGQGQSLSAGEGSGSVKKGGKAAKASGGTKKAAPKKRKVEESGDDKAVPDHMLAEGGPVGGSAKKRARINAEEEDRPEGVKEERFEQNYVGLGEEPEREDEEFFDAEDYEGEGPEYEI
jgi:hypothetical protein